MGEENLYMKDRKRCIWKTDAAYKSGKAVKMLKK